MTSTPGFDGVAALASLATPRRDLNVVVNQLVARCMAQQSFGYPPQADTSGQASAPALGVTVVTVSEANAARDGYDLWNQDTAEVSPADEVAFSASMNPAERQRYELALFGDPHSTTVLHNNDGSSLTVANTGCLAGTRRAVYGSLEEFERQEYFYSNLQTSVGAKVAASQTYSTLMTDWSRCMKSAGFNFSTPSDAIGSVRAAYGPNGPTGPGNVLPIDIQTAVADARCQASTKALSTLQQLNATATSDVLSANEAQIVAYMTFVKEAQARAGQLLAGS